MRGTSKTYQYLVRIKKFYSDLVSQGKMKEPTKESFFKDYLGYGKTYWIKLYEKNDLRKVFYVVADLLEETKQLRENKDNLEKKLDELLKK
jgi:hypothetical protein